LTYIDKTSTHVFCSQVEQKKRPSPFETVINHHGFEIKSALSPTIGEVALAKHVDGNIFQIFSSDGTSAR
jgi:hypothetical protein